MHKESIGDEENNELAVVAHWLPAHFNCLLLHAGAVLKTWRLHDWTWALHDAFASLHEQNLKVLRVSELLLELGSLGFLPLHPVVDALSLCKLIQLLATVDEILSLL